MIKIRIRWFALISFGLWGCLIMAGLCRAHSLSNRDGKQARLLVSNIGVTEGLSDSHVFCVRQDQQGYIWFGTIEGLNRFDGYTIKSYKRDSMVTALSASIQNPVKLNSTHPLKTIPNPLVRVPLVLFVTIRKGHYGWEHLKGLTNLI